MLSIFNKFGLFQRKRSTTLAGFFGVDKLEFKEADYEGLIRSTAFMVIDVQKEFADPAHPEKNANETTDRMSRRIASLTPEFRAAGLRPYWVYYADYNGQPAAEASGGWHHVQPQEGDDLIAKEHTSAFAHRKNRMFLQEKGIDKLIVSGFYANACVMDTVKDALACGFRVCVLRDAVENCDGSESETRYNLKAMRYKGALTAMSGDVLACLRKLRAGFNPS